MLLLQANNIQKSYGAKTVLDFQQFLVYEGDKIGVVGANGAGKTTLLNVLAREIQPDKGTVSGDWEVAYIHQFEEQDATRSGGENAKRRIRQKTVSAGQILFADEPTANLDIEGQKWVRKKLLQAGTVLLVSHDRDLLDELCNKIVALEDGKLTEYTGTYSDYEAAIQLQKARQQQAFTEYQRKKAQLEEAIRSKERSVSSMKAAKKAQYKKNSSEARLRGDIRASIFKKVEREEKVLTTRLEKLPKAEKLRELPGLRINFSLTQPPGGRNVVRCEHLHFSYGDNTVLRDASFVIANRAKIAVTGKNGAGKSTLLQLIYEGCGAITAVPKLRWGFLYQSFENLDLERSVLDNVLLSSIQDRATVRSVLAGLLFFGDAVFKPASALSGGEKMRLSLAKLLTCEANALLLDEPTNYLDLQAVEAVQRMVGEYPGTLLLVSHDARFVELVAKERLHIEDGKIVPCPVIEAKATAPSPAQKTLLEMRLTRLVAQISSAPPEQKTLLEAEYQSTLEQLKQI